MIGNPEVGKTFLKNLFLNSNDVTISNWENKYN